MKTNRKKIVLIVLLVLLLLVGGFIVGIGIFFNDNSTKDSNVEKYIDSINELNSDLINNEMFADNYQKLDDVKCITIKAEEKDKYIKKIESVYTDPFGNNSVFRTKRRLDETKEDLLVCIPLDCEIKDIKSYKVVKEFDDRKIVQLGDSEYVLWKENDGWKFSFPIVMCE